MAHVLLVFGSVNIVSLEWLEYGTARISEQDRRIPHIPFIYSRDYTLQDIG